MRVSLNWIKEFVDVDIDIHELKELLTMHGLEVEAVELLGRGLRDVLCAKIVSVRSHPNADRLMLCDVDMGDRVVQVVSGAPNLREGLKVPIALPGTILPGGNRVKEVKLRGEISEGILLAEDEMGLTDDHSGIMELPEDTPIGLPITSVLSVEDWAMDIAITPNRADCVSILGIAREICALTGKELKDADIIDEGDDLPIEDITDVTIEDPEGCPRYCAGVIRGIDIKRAPFWMRYRLFISGIRAINNIVDITNYVMLEMGQPLHAFDLQRLRGSRIVVKRAKPDELFTTLDGKTHRLNEGVLMICDAERSVAIAGIMGGLNSEIFEGSQDVLIESAFFDPITIRRGAKSLGISTEASYRFERGVDIDGVTRALKRAMFLIRRYAGGKVAKGIIDNYPKKRKIVPIRLSIHKTNALLGTELKRDELIRYLRSLRMKVKEIDNEFIEVIPPSYRVDIDREVDLMEEIARLKGYDSIPTTFPHIRRTQFKERPEQKIYEEIKDILIGCGISEAITYSFISPSYLDYLHIPQQSPLRSYMELKNPLSSEQGILRTTLLPGIIDTVKRNINQGERNLRLFELGNVFFKRKDQPLPDEIPSLIVAITGRYQQKEWYGEERDVDFYDIKGIVELLLKCIGISKYFIDISDFPWYAQYSVSILLDRDRIVGDMGRISTEVMQAFDMEEIPFYVLQLNLLELLKGRGVEKSFSPLPRYPAVWRDLSVVLKKEIRSDTVRELIQKVGGEIVESVRVFDMFEGGKIPQGYKALAFRIVYRSSKRTLDGSEVDQVHNRIIQGIQKELGGRLREA